MGPAPISKIPLFQRPGTIVCRKERARRSSALMVNDPYTLIIALDAQGRASGSLFVDDGVSYGYESGRFICRTFTYEAGVLSSSAGGVVTASDFSVASTIERVVVFGLETPLTATPQLRVGDVVTTLAVTRHWSYNEGPTTVIRKPDVNIGSDFSINVA